MSLENRRTLARACAIARAVAYGAVVVLALAGIPGARLRSLDRSEVPATVRGTVGASDGQIEVSVRDAADGRPLAGAYVRLLAMVDDRAHPLDTRPTDLAGAASFERVPRCEIWILAQAPGHARGSAHIVSDAGKRTVRIDLNPGHSMSVSVRDDLGAAVAGGQLEILSADDPLPVGARTGADGTKRVEDLGAGPWRVTARSAGYEDTTVRVERDGDAADLVLRKLGAMLVHVAQAGDREAPGARVYVAGATLWPAREADTDSHGDVRIAGLAAGTYGLRAVKGDLVSSIELGVALARGEEKSVLLRLSPGNFANVRVTDGEGTDAEPVAAADVSLAEGGISPFPLEAVTDAKGRARLGPVAPGPVTLSVSAEGFVAKGGVPLVDPWPGEIRLALVRAGAVAGEVVDARGDPIDGATIQVVGTDPTGAPILDDPRRASFRGAHFEAMLSGAFPLIAAGELGVTPGPVPPIPGATGVTEAWLPRASSTYPISQDVEPWITHEDGTFLASPASPGRVRVVVRHPQYVEAESDVVSLAPGGQVSVRVVMHEGGVLEGRVLDAHDQPVGDARVYAFATRGSVERTTRSGTDGTFAFAALPDQITLTVGAEGDETPDVRLLVTIPEGGRKELTVRLPEARDPLPVTVVDDRGYPIDTAQVSTTSLSLDSPLRATSFTDANGETAIERARGLPLRVEVHAPSRAPRIVITAGAERSLRVELDAGETAEGDVFTAAARDPVVGAELAIETTSGTKRARTDLQGHYSFADLAAGSARLRVRAAGFAPKMVSVDIPERRGKRSYDLDRIDLEAEGVVHGDVVDAEGNPVVGARVARDHVPTWLLVGSNPEDVAVTDQQGKFTLRELAEGSATLEAYAPDRGRGVTSGVSVVAGQTTDGVRIAIAADEVDSGAGPPLLATGGVAVTLSESGTPPQVSIVSVVDGSEAERAGLATGDVLVQLDDEPVVSMEQARAKLNGPISDDVLVRVQRADRTLVFRVARDEVRR